ncbi:MAG: HPr family phosphocarrier protein [Phycisphaerales bacterium]|nr:HPr family phosphocarrier protein [Phycisphaerales bacterium]
MRVAVERTVVIANKEGLHFRPIMRLVDTVGKYSATVRLQVEERVADASSAMELLMLVATQGSMVRVTADGDQADEAADAVVQLIDNGFGE